jgi:hypothetical protein
MQRTYALVAALPMKMIAGNTAQSLCVSIFRIGTWTMTFGDLCNVDTNDVSDD